VRFINLFFGNIAGSGLLLANKEDKVYLIGAAHIFNGWNQTIRYIESEEPVYTSDTQPSIDKTLTRDGVEHSTTHRVATITGKSTVLAYASSSSDRR
jgi:hypothetical protein